MSPLIRHLPVAGKKVSFFITCIMDMIYPETGLSAVEVLERLGCEIVFPEAQTCCGQMGFNAGYRNDARAVARHFLEAFKDAEVIVTPSGSCAAMVRHLYPELFQDDPAWFDRAIYAASITWELTEYIVDGLGVTDIGAALGSPTKVAFHQACHGLRMLGIQKQPETLVGAMANAEVTPLPGADQCCGFGGLFAVKMPDVSGALLNDKIRNINACEAATIVTCDASCLTQMNGGLQRQGSAKRVVHVADVLAEKVGNDDSGKHSHGE
jgi:L-lactate dehydrogenase complex protein LldE